jgi:hypothetical protein
MSASSFPKGPYTVGKIGEVTRILDAKGNDLMTLPGGPERLVACANALSEVWFPENHVKATDEYVKRLEQLRKDAWARVQELEAKLALAGVPA